MLQTNTWGCFIIRQRFYRRYNTLRILTGIVAGIITALILYAIGAIIYSVPYSIIPPILAVFGVFLLILSIFTNIKRRSPLKLGAANRGEFYAVVVILISALFYLNGRIDGVHERIDDIYQILLAM